ncbi:hypothetical protein BDP27DRAFT_1317534 [Rhodocollybia butyracea]|uniref:F-box domain-containing protein n=1 Tax=Rhodocollybia butyracea TaxID=206335 RepID=A0A9P5UBL6_9AGAR|nr:hypothetical protein BDP27DRAFT_1317534 [Rhodocollybia butyracea]
MGQSKASLTTTLDLEPLSLLILGSLRPIDLASLNLVSKGCRQASLPILYSRIMIYNSSTARKILNTIFQQPKYGPFVNTLLFSSSRGQTRCHHVLSREMTSLLAKVLPILSNLEYLLISDVWALSAAIFARYQEISSNLGVCQLYGITISGQGRVVEFLSLLAKQKALRTLKMSLNALPEDYINLQLSGQQDNFTLPPNCLPALTVFEGPIFIGSKLIQAQTPLENIRLHLPLDYDTSFTLERGIQPELLSSVLDLKALGADIACSHVGKTLKTLALWGFPSDEELHDLQYAKKETPLPDLDVTDVLGDFLHTLALQCPHLRHIGALPLPSKDCSSIHEALMEMHSLRSIEFNVSPWLAPSSILTPSLGIPHSVFPSPTTLKAISMEMKMYCPTLRYFVYTLRPQPSARYHRIDRVVWICSSSRNDNMNTHAKAAKQTGWESEWTDLWLLMSG